MEDVNDQTVESNRKKRFAKRSITAASSCTHVSVEQEKVLWCVTGDMVIVCIGPFQF